MEKITKAFGLYEGFLTEKELYARNYKMSWTEKQLIKFNLKKRNVTIGHITPRAFILLLKKKFIKPYFKLALPLVKNNGIKNKLKTYDKELHSVEKLIDKNNELARISHNDILEILRICSQYELILSSFDSSKLKLSLQEFKLGLRTRLEKFLPPDIMNQIDEKLKTIDTRLDDILVGLTLYSSLYPLSMITFSHFNSTRYPTKEMSPKDYDEKLGIVSASSKISEHLDFVLKRFSKMIGES